jgi:hypothetical protein
MERPSHYGRAAGHGVPELRDILMCIVQRGTLSGELRQSPVDNLMVWVRATRYAQENVRIDETRSNRHLVVVLVDPFAGDRRWERRNPV